MNELLFQFYKIFTHGIMGIFFTCLTLFIRHLAKKYNYKKKLKIIADRCKKLGINGKLAKALSSKNDTFLELLSIEPFREDFTKKAKKAEEAEKKKKENKNTIKE